MKYNIIGNMYYKTTNYCISAYSSIDIPTIDKAKEVLNTKYKNIYDAPAHITYNISPIPKYNIKKIISPLKDHILKQKRFDVTMGTLKIDEKKRFIYLPIGGKKLYKIHSGFVSIMNTYRDGYVRTKDIRRIESDPDYYSEGQKKSIVLYGFARTHKYFVPHLTIGKVAENHSPTKVFKEVASIVADAKVKKIKIGTINLLCWIASAEDKPGRDVWEKCYPLK